jgi:hypothetical protein
MSPQEGAELALTMTSLARQLGQVKDRDYTVSDRAAELGKLAQESFKDTKVPVNKRK